MIGPEDAPYTYEYDDYFKILPAIHNWNADPRRIAGGKPVGPDFLYSSDNNKEWLSKEELSHWIYQNLAKLEG